MYLSIFMRVYNKFNYIMNINMHIGYVSITDYDSIRYDLFFNENAKSTKTTYYFVAFGCKNYIDINNDYYKNEITKNKKIWITLSHLKPSEIYK